MLLDLRSFTLWQASYWPNWPEVQLLLTTVTVDVYEAPMCMKRQCHESVSQMPDMGKKVTFAFYPRSCMRLAVVEGLPTIVQCLEVRLLIPL